MTRRRTAGLSSRTRSAAWSAPSLLQLRHTPVRSFTHRARRGEQVYDATKYLDAHPGGASSILITAGTDCTDEFEALHSSKAWKLLEGFVIGTLASGDAPAATGAPAPAPALAPAPAVEAPVKAAPVAADSESAAERVKGPAAQPEEVKLTCCT